MISSIKEYLEELKEAFVPTVAKAEDEVDEEEEEDEEDEEEMVDQLDTLKKQATETPEGAELQHHYLECVERVQKSQEEPGYDDLEYKEDCVEEFFHLQHYMDSHSAPRLFSQLK